MKFNSNNFRWILWNLILTLKLNLMQRHLFVWCIYACTDTYGPRNPKMKKKQSKSWGLPMPPIQFKWIIKKKKKNLKKQFKWSLGSPYKQRPEGTAAPYWRCQCSNTTKGSCQKDLWDSRPIIITSTMWRCKRTGFTTKVVFFFFWRNTKVLSSAQRVSSYCKSNSK